MNDLFENAGTLVRNMMNLSDEEMEKTIKDFRTQRIANKAIENKNKKPLNSPDVLNADDFTFVPYVQKRGTDGDSGELLLATRKSDVSEKYIVKHAFCDCAANEFVYSKMARAMGLQMPEVKLFRLSNPLDDTLFKTEYVAGIKYLNVVDENPSFDVIFRSRNEGDYYPFLTLHKIFLENDLLQVVLADDGYIYRIDCSDAFAINDVMLMNAGVYTNDKNNSEHTNGLSSVKAGRLKTFWNIFDIDQTIQAYISEYGFNTVELLLQPLFAVQKVHKTYINKFLETLCYFYPDIVGEYYSSFFVELKKRMKYITVQLADKYS